MVTDEQVLSNRISILLYCKCEVEKQSIPLLTTTHYTLAELSFFILPYFMIDKIETKRIGELFSKFREQNLTAEQHYENWASTTEEESLPAYTNRCFADAFHLISKYARDEQEFREWNIELMTNRWKYELQTKNGKTNIFLKQILINRALVECQDRENWPYLLFNQKTAAVFVPSIMAK